ncbi:predicted protein [Micromonas commoda]|uniref:Uncharacterized protein n=1 Tax=Micromonas commoda (strain RCC299 / NOUM17 / CCMP2709) TaxID=296587 RepID=C1E2F2_MICCC|nr:predicted protein [Micromonas commoda]ACO62331.1 predicted protein [Micromonas commoda]|eukprot:XP_002501073.1 predicted protein [Micromonas commoda]
MAHVLLLVRRSDLSLLILLVSNFLVFIISLDILDVVVSPDVFPGCRGCGRLRGLLRGFFLAFAAAAPSEQLRPQLRQEGLLLVAELLGCGDR